MLASTQGNEAKKFNTALSLTKCDGLACGCAIEAQPEDDEQLLLSLVGTQL